MDDAILRKGAKVATASLKLLFVFLGFVVCPLAFAGPSAVLEHPDQDVKRLFPESTHYRVRDLFWSRHVTPDVRAKAKAEGVASASAEEPCMFYAVYSGKQMIGLIHGESYEGKSGQHEVFVAYRRDGRISDIHLQRFAAQDVAHFRSKYYRTQFQKHGIGSVFDVAHILPPVRIPSADTLEEHHALVKALRENVLTVKHLYNAITKP